jgi:hypothetical protein
MLKVEEKEFIDDQLRALNRDTIKLWDDHLDKNYTINFVLNKPEWRRLYEKLVYEFEKVEMGMYVYPFERLHMTLLGRIDKNMDPEKLVETVRKNMLGEKFVFKVGYLANNNQSLSIISEPDFELNVLRDKVRADLGVSGDDYTKYSNIYERLAWFNFIRFKSLPGDKFFETLWNMRNFQFGEFEAKDIDIYLNTSKTMDPAKCKLIEKITL